MCVRRRDTDAMLFQIRQANKLKSIAFTVQHTWLEIRMHSGW
jgi:hypothetical protein